MEKTEIEMGLLEPEGKHEPAPISTPTPIPAPAPTPASSTPAAIAMAPTTIKINPHPSDEVDPVPNIDLLSRILIGIAYFVFTITAPLSIWFSYVIIAEYERGVWLRLGRLKEKTASGPGAKFKIPFIDRIVIVDMRTKTLNVRP
uniref:Band 7 domain-containing protein n=1 Tax=Panagrolaimus sp. ES5 TaxID=591445 RepID=A0AC34F2N1_9BILA